MEAWVKSSTHLIFEDCLMPNLLLNGYDEGTSSNVKGDED